MDDDFDRPKGFLLVAIGFELAVGLGALALGWALDQSPLEQLRWDGQAALWGAAAAVPPLAALQVGRRLPLAPLQRLFEVSERLVQQMFAGYGLLSLALVSAAAGIGEEMLFRGLIQPVIGEKFGIVGGVSAAAVAFGLAHPITRTYALVAAGIGLYLGWLMVWQDNLLAPIVTHAVYDFVALMWLLRGSGSRAGCVDPEG
ncbi:MAG: CPBP family intramembrane metalloprotease [Planctomycetes bacterium]|nr:CPBP family intramembrane metalloprotease [Planctomycetota bacterium]